MKTLKKYYIFKLFAAYLFLMFLPYGIFAFGKEPSPLVCKEGQQINPLPIFTRDISAVILDSEWVMVPQTFGKDAIQIGNETYGIKLKQDHPTYPVSLLRLDRSIPGDIPMSHRYYKALSDSDGSNLIFAAGAGCLALQSHQVSLNETPTSDLVSIQDLLIEPNSAVYVETNGLGGTDHQVAGIVVEASETCTTIQLLTQELNDWINAQILMDALGQEFTAPQQEDDHEKDREKEKEGKGSTSPQGIPDTTPLPPLPHQNPEPLIGGKSDLPQNDYTPPITMPPAPTGQPGPDEDTNTPAPTTGGAFAAPPAAPPAPPANGNPTPPPTGSNNQNRKNLLDLPAEVLQRMMMGLDRAYDLKYWRGVSKDLRALSKDPVLLYSYIKDGVELTNSTVGDILKANMGSHSPLLGKLFNPEFLSSLEEKQSGCTLFVPTNAALALLPGKFIEDLERSNSKVREYAQNCHLVEGNIILPFDERPRKFKTEADKELSIYKEGNQYLITEADEKRTLLAVVVGKPILGKDGLTYFIDAPLTNGFSQDKMTTGAKKSQSRSSGSLKPFLRNSVYKKLEPHKECSIFIELLKKTSLSTTIRQTPFTVIALDNEVLKKVAQQLGYSDDLSDMPTEMARYFLSTLLLESVKEVQGNFTGASPQFTEIKHLSWSHDSIRFNSRYIVLEMLDCKNPQETSSYYPLKNGDLSIESTPNGSLIVLKNPAIVQDDQLTTKQYIFSNAFLDRFSNKSATPAIKGVKVHALCPEAIFTLQSAFGFIDETKIDYPALKCRVIEEMGITAQIFREYLKNSGELINLTNSQDPKTLFIPTDSALTKLSQTTYEDLAKDSALQSEFVRGHILAGNLELKLGQAFKNGYILKIEHVGNLNIYLISTPIIEEAALKAKSTEKSNLLDLINSNEEIKATVFYKDFLCQIPEKHEVRQGNIRCTPDQKSIDSSKEDIVQNGRWALFLPNDLSFEPVIKYFMKPERFGVDDKPYLWKQFLVHLPDGEDSLKAGKYYTASNELVTVEDTGFGELAIKMSQGIGRVELLVQGTHCSVYLINDVYGLLDYFDKRFGYSRDEKQNDPLISGGRGTAIRMDKAGVNKMHNSGLDSMSSSGTGDEWGDTDNTDLNGWDYNYGGDTGNNNDAGDNGEPVLSN